MDLRATTGVGRKMDGQKGWDPMVEQPKTHINVISHVETRNRHVPDSPELVNRIKGHTWCSG